MKNMQRNVLGLSLLALLTLTSCNSGGGAATGTNVGYTQDGQTAYNALAGVTRQNTYTYYESYLPTSLNSITTMQSEDSRYITNVVDGLVDVDRTGTIIPGLAQSWSFNATNTELTLQIRSDVPWVYNRNFGRDEFKVDGVTQYVKAEDWVYAARQNLTFANGSDSYYLYTMFIEGATEFYYYTAYRYLNSVAEDPSEVLTDEQIAANLVRITGDSSITVDTFPSIANFSRVGIKASNSGRTLTYTLTDTAPYFLSSLTYTPFFPVCEAFVETLPGKAADYGSGANPANILANGAYVMDGYTPGVSSDMYFRANYNYWDAEHVMTKNIHVLHYPDNAGYNATRIAYEAGTIDGFTVNQLDGEGWNKYVTGGTGGSGSVDAPVSSDARVTEGLGDASTFAFIFNTDRDAHTTGSTNALQYSVIPTVSGWDAVNGDGENLQVLNTNKALSVSPALRALILQSLDIENYTNGFGTDEYQRTRYLVNTWTPANFVTYTGYTEADNADGIFGNDYIDFVKKEYMDKFYSSENYSATARAAAEAALGYSQISSGTYSAGIKAAGLNESTTLDADNQKKLDDLKAAAQAEINAWNAANASDRITTPVIVEFPSLVYDSNSYQEHASFINSTNARVNGCWYGGDAISSNIGRPDTATVCSGTQEADAIFRLVTPSAEQIQTNRAYQIVSAYSWGSLIVSGWGPDYSDPLTFANTLVTDGDLSGNTGVNSGNIYHEQLAEQFAEYDSLVAEASKITENKARYEKFAEAEIELLYDVSIIRPLQMRGLGKSVVVSKTVPFRVTSATYGVSSYKYKYIEVLNRPVTNTEYQALRGERSVRNSK